MCRCDRETSAEMRERSAAAGPDVTLANTSTGWDAFIFEKPWPGTVQAQEPGGLSQLFLARCWYTESRRQSGTSPAAEVCPERSRGNRLLHKCRKKLRKCLVGIFFWATQEKQPAFASVQHSARAGRQDTGLTPVVSRCMATGNAASWFAISFHTDTVFPAFSSLPLLISGLWGREGRGNKRKGRGKREKRKRERKRKRKKERKKRQAIANPKDPSSTIFNRLSPVILALDNQTVQHKVISL